VRLFELPLSLTSTWTLTPPRLAVSRRIPPAMILLWVELSHAMQWFTSWGIFVWIGKVSYGFYLMQFLTLYGVMPHIILHFANQGHSYWNVVTPTYILCLMTNFFIAWWAVLESELLVTKRR
jgi:peptidoglycan/LPS O-acetylase OafA/YrhL